MKEEEPIADFFNYGALQVLGALEGKTAEEMAISLLEEERMMREKNLTWRNFGSISNRIDADMNRGWY